MTDFAKQTRKALAALPEGTSHGETPAPHQVYLPRSHVNALHPDNLLVTGIRGAGKTFWWSALQDSDIRHLVGHYSHRSPLSEKTEVRTGFGVKPAVDHYPNEVGLRDMLSTGVEPRFVWRTVHAWQLTAEGHPLRRYDSWSGRAEYVVQHPDAIQRLFQERDLEFARKDVYFLILFDALDRCSDDWKSMYRLLRGLLQFALELRSYRRLRAKIFLRTDQVDERRIADFPDASKVLSSAVELSWPRRELYGLLWHYLANGPNGELFRRFLLSGHLGAPVQTLLFPEHNQWSSVDVGTQLIFSVPREIVREEHQRSTFHAITGPWMGKGPKQGFPYTWISNHLGDTDGRVSPRSFLAALRRAAEDTDAEYSEYEYALHYDSVKRGAQDASRIRVGELREDYPWVDDVMKPLSGMVVPCTFNEISERWDGEGVLDRVRDAVEQDDVKLPPRHIDDGASGVRLDLESLGVFQRLLDGRVNIPDVFRVGYGLGRKGGVRPIR